MFFSPLYKRKLIWLIKELLLYHVLLMVSLFLISLNLFLVNV